MALAVDIDVPLMSTWVCPGDRLGTTVSARNQWYMAAAHVYSCAFHYVLVSGGRPGSNGVEVGLAFDAG